MKKLQVFCLVLILILAFNGALEAKILIPPFGSESVQSSGESASFDEVFIPICPLEMEMLGTESYETFTSIDNGLLQVNMFLVSEDEVDIMNAYDRYFLDDILFTDIDFSLIEQKKSIFAGKSLSLSKHISSQGFGLYALSEINMQ